MTATLPVARDDILDKFATIWTPTGHPVHYPGIADKDFPPATQIPWARAQFLPVGGTQVTLANGVGQKRFRHTGLLTIQVFTPLGTDQAFSAVREAYDLAQTVMDGFQGQDTPNGVLFRQIQTATIGPTGGWFQVNVTVGYEYDEIA